MQQQTPMAIKIHTHKSKPLSVVVVFVVVCSPEVLSPSSPLDELHAVVVGSLQPKQTDPHHSSTGNMLRR